MHQPKIIIFKNLPFPPSENAAYRNVPGRGRVKAQVLKDFYKELEVWEMRNRAFLKAVREYVKHLKAIQLDMYLGVHRSRIYCKDGAVKRFDASNRIKAAHDGLAMLIEKDDSFFFAGYFEKKELPDTAIERVTMVLREFTPRAFLDDQCGQLTGNEALFSNTI